ncbi:L-threonylcarbamoyladenylate synthase [Cumulibacter manganitolerans]|uniref:L-threonylcarbamoyladenylate synthase n=1 Tax=Cumulibacter manganitolerans TaxID=1884992 RepID=UPI001E545083|nr:L-threonylcarbamoyladenylate synthase [Cumulibacter manganitolerans]
MTAYEIVDVSSAAEPAYGLAIERAANTLKDGRLVVLPTDTVYGIAADAFSSAAVAALLAAKGRGRDYPVPVLVANPGVLHGLVTVAPPTAVALTERFWPGALTVIVDYSRSLAWDLGETGGTVALRMPNCRVTLDVLERTGPLAVSSANRHGQAPGATGAAAAEQLGDGVDLYLEAGELPGALPSTIVDCTVTPPQVVREGALTIDQLREVVPDIA